MTNKCVIQTKVVKDGTMTEPAFLEPGVHQGLYNIPQITAARQFMVENEFVGSVGINIDDKRVYSVTRVPDGAYPQYAIELDPTPRAETEETQNVD